MSEGLPVSVCVYMYERGWGIQTNRQTVKYKVGLSGVFLVKIKTSDLDLSRQVSVASL